MDDHTIPEYILDLIRLIQRTPYGEVPVTLKIHDGKVASVVSNAFRSKKFKEGENAAATAEVVAMIKNMVDSKKSGAISYTIVFNSGNIKEVIAQFTEKHLYSLKTDT